MKMKRFRFIRAYCIAGLFCLLLTHQLGAQTSTTNTAIIPVPKLENDSYDWYKRHDEVLACQKAINPQIVMIGDSITHFWGGEPKANHLNGPNAWKETYGDIPVLNMGFGWDRTQNVLWRLEHGEFDGLHPKKLVLNIGTNNFSPTKNARANSPAEICEAIIVICDKIRAKSPDTRIIVMGVLPRGNKPTDHWRPKIKELNALLAGKLKGMNGITFLDIWDKMLEPDGTLSKDIMPDSTHPSEKGYSIWGKALIAAGVRE